MKRAVIVLMAALIAALAIFTITCGAQTTDKAKYGSGVYAADTAKTNVYIDSDQPYWHSDKEVLDVAAADKTVDDGEVEEDGINTKVASVWIIGISAVFIAAILISVILLAKRNKEQK